MFKVWNSVKKQFVGYAVSQPLELSGYVVVFIGSEPNICTYLCKESERMDVFEAVKELLK